MKKLVSLSLVCGALVFAASCSSNSNKSASSNSATTTEASTPATAEEATTTTPEETKNNGIPGLDTIKASNTIHLTGNDNMQYNRTLFKVKVGDKITLSMKNIGKLPATAMSHDVVVLKEGTDLTAFANAAQQAKGGEHIPASMKDEVIAATKMLGPGEVDKITFTISKAGVYPFLCTFPGHYGTMNGKIVAVAK